MHTGKSYKLSEFLVWTRRNIYILIVLGIVPVILYEIAGLKWLGIPWSVVALLGTATAFIVGFTNIQTYNRTWEARKVWSDIASASRAWGTMSRDFLSNPEKTKELVYRHLAWLTAMRYQMREHRPWEKKVHLRRRPETDSPGTQQSDPDSRLAKQDHKGTLCRAGNRCPPVRSHATGDQGSLRFSVVISWMYTSLEQIGESTENPFQGSANDIPVSQMCREIEIDLREMLGETELHPLLKPKNNIIL